MIIRKCWCGLLNWAVREAFLACKENLLLFCTAPIPGTLVSRCSSKQACRAPEMGDHGELLPSLEILSFCLFVFLALELSLSTASTAAATVSLLQFSLEAGVRRQGLGVAGREGRVRWCEAVDAGWEMGTVPSPGNWGDSPPHFSSAKPFLPATGSEEKEFEVCPSPSFSYVLAPLYPLISPLAPHRCHLLCMWQRCECFCWAEEELAIKKVALSRTTCVIYVISDRLLIWFYLLCPLSSWRMESGFKAVELLWKVWSRRAENLNVVGLVIHRNKIVSNWDFLKILTLF